MIPRPGMRYVRPDGSGARVVLVEDGVVWLHDGVKRPASTMVPVHGYALDWADGATLGAVEHDVLGPAGWWVERCMTGDGLTYQAWSWCESFHEPRASLTGALRDALEVIGG